MSCLRWLRGTPAVVALGGQYTGAHSDGVVGVVGMWREWSGHMQQLLCVHGSGSILCLGRTVGKNLLLPPKKSGGCTPSDGCLSLPASL